MKKFTKKWQLILYGCSGLGVNMLNLIVGSYLCSALLTGGFEDHIESWTYLNKDLVVAGLWGTLIFVAKAIDGIIDIPFSHFTDNLKTKWGRRRPAILIGFIPMLIAYLLFLVPLTNGESIANTVWFAAMLFVFYGCYTLTMLTFYGTFAEVVEKKEDIVLLSNTKSICDVVYFSLGYALVPAFVSMGVNIRTVALIFLPLSLTMMIPLFLLKEKPTNDGETVEKSDKPSFIKSITFSLKCKDFVFWMVVASIMNFGLQLFLGGINEYFSTAGLNMTFIMATCFAPVPFTILLYNKLVRKRGLGFAYRYILCMYSAGMALMYLCNFDFFPKAWLLPYALFCSLLISFSIGAFFAVTYTVPSNLAAMYKKENEAASSMFFAVEGLFEGISAGIATGFVLVYLKDSGNICYMTLLVAAACMLAFTLSFFLPNSIQQIGKLSAEKK